MSEWTEVRISLRAYASLIPTRLQLDLTYALSSTLILTHTFGPRSSLLVMATTERVDLDSLVTTDPKKAEAIYKSILQGGVCLQPPSFGMLTTARRIEIRG